MAESHPEIRQRIRSFIANELLRKQNVELNDDMKLFTTRLIDSFALAELGVYIEGEFGVYVPDADLSSENMDTISRITKRIASAMND